MTESQSILDQQNITLDTNRSELSTLLATPADANLGQQLTIDTSNHVTSNLNNGDLGAKLETPRKPPLLLKNENTSRQNSIDVPIPSSILPVPPDGGWGWVIVAASFMTNMIVDGITYSFGILLPEFRASLGGSVELGALIGSLLVGCYLLVGPIVGGLVNRYEARPVMITGAIVACFAFFVSYWANSISYLMATFGILGGIGSGLIYLPGVVYVGYYFEKKRALATGISVAGSGMGAFIFPPLTAALIDMFTWRGAMWIFAGIALNCAVFGSLMRPLPKPKALVVLQKQISRSRSNLQASDWTLNNYYNKDAIGITRKLTARTESSHSQISGMQSPRQYSHHKLIDNLIAGELNAEKISRVGSGLGMQAPTLDAVKEEPYAEQREDVTKKTAKAPGEPRLSEVDESKSNDENLSPNSPETARSDEVFKNDDEIVQNSPKKSKNMIHVEEEDDDQPIHFKISELSDQSGNVHLDATSSPLPPHVAPPAFSPRAAEIGLSTADVSSVNLESGAGGGGQQRPSFSRMVSRSSRLSVRDFTNSLHRLASSTAVSNLGNGALLSNMDSSQLNLAASIDPTDFAKPFARQDIFLSGSIQNLNAFRRSGSNMRSYRESIVSVPRGVELYQSTIDGAMFAVPEMQDHHWYNCIPMPVRAVLRQMLDVDLLSNWTMLLLSASNFCGFVAFYVPYVYLTSYAIDLGINKSEASIFLSVIGVTNTAGRVIYGWMSDKGWIRSIHINNIALLLCGLVTMMVPLCQTYSTLALYAALFGFFNAAFVCLTSIILVEHLGLHRLTNAFGLLILVRGLACLIGSPLGGYVYTMFGSFKASFLFSGILTVLAAIISALIPIIEKKSSMKNGNGGRLKNSASFDEEDEETNILSDWAVREAVDRRLADIIEGLADPPSPQDDAPASPRSAAAQAQPSPKISLAEKPGPEGLVV